MARKVAKTVSFAYLSLITSFFLQSHPTLGLPLPIQPRYDSKAPLLELCVENDATLAPGSLSFNIVAGLPPCWDYAPLPSKTGATVPTGVQASQPALTIIIPVASDSVPQLIPQAVRPTNSVEVQANGGQETQGQDRTGRGDEEETFMTTFVALDSQYATPTSPVLSGKSTAYVHSLEGGTSPSVPYADQPSEVRDPPSQVDLPLGARVALGIAVPVVLTGIVVFVWMLYRRRSQHSIDVVGDKAAGSGTDEEKGVVYQLHPYPSPSIVQHPEPNPEKMDALVLSASCLPSHAPNRFSKMTFSPSTTVSGHIRRPSLDGQEPITEAVGFASIDRAPPLVCAQPSLVRKGIVNFSRPLKALKSPLSTPAMKMPPTPKLTPKVLRTPNTPNFSLSLPRTTVYYPGNRQTAAIPRSNKTPTTTKRRFSPQGMILYSTGDSTLPPTEDVLDPRGDSITGESIIAAYEANTPKKRLVSFKADLSPSKLLGCRTTLSPIISIFSPKLGPSLGFPEVTKTSIKPLHLCNKKVIKPPQTTSSQLSRVDDNDPGFSQFIQGFIANNEAYHAKRIKAIQEAEEKENLPVVDENSSSGLGPLLPPLSFDLDLTAGSSMSTLPSLMSDSGSQFESDRRI